MRNKIIATITLMYVFTSFVFAQTSTHLMFKGIPIDGTLNSFVTKLKQNGLKHIQTEAQTAILKGDFASYKNCTIGISTLDTKDLVYKVVVIFTERDTWEKLSANYFDLKQMLTEKYGGAAKNLEEFDSNSQLDDDFTKMHNVKMDRCKYYSIWETEKGDIQLTISHDNLLNCYIVLAYFDNINSSTIKDKAIDDL